MPSLFITKNFFKTNLTAAISSSVSAQTQSIACDYHRKAGRLNILQHGVYNLLMDACYDREAFPTEAQAIDWVWAETDEEIAAVKFVLKKFFVI
jgi:uncharacterized protein YdaU (DUF1376 family)